VNIKLPSVQIEKYMYIRNNNTKTLTCWLLVINSLSRMFWENLSRLITTKIRLEKWKNSLVTLVSQKKTDPGEFSTH